MPVANKILVLGPVSRILSRALRRGGRHFSQVLANQSSVARLANQAGEGGCGIPAAIERAAQPPILPCTGRGFSCRRRRRRRGGLLPHLFTLAHQFPDFPLSQSSGFPISGLFSVTLSVAAL